MCIYNHPRDDCCITSSGSTNGLKVERLILWSKQRWAVHWAASATPHPPPHSTNQTVGWLITPPPLPSAHRWDVRLKVDGEQRCVWCYTPSYRLEFGLQTARPPPHPLHLYPAAARDLYPSGILPPPPMPFVTAGPCWRLPLKKKKKKKRVEGLPLWFWVIYEVPLSAYSAVVFTVFCQRNIKVSEVVRANHSGQKCLSLATECFISLQLKPSLCVIKAEEIQLWEIKDPQMRGGGKNASRTHTLTSLLCTKQFLIYAQ